jgi:hypothetical protein
MLESRKAEQILRGRGGLYQWEGEEVEKWWRRVNRVQILCAQWKYVIC